VAAAAPKPEAPKPAAAAAPPAPKPAAPAAKKADAEVNKLAAIGLGGCVAIALLHACRHNSLFHASAAPGC
jgi:hypothetical protein